MFLLQKRNADDLPITSIKVSKDRPCFDPGEENTFGIVKALNTDCKPVGSTLQSSAFDWRYKSAGLNIAGRVFKDNDKKDYKVWFRSTIPWSLSCEMKKDEALDIIRAVDSFGLRGVSDSMIVWPAIVIYALVIV